MQDFNEFLNSFYTNDPPTAMQAEKTAEERLALDLQLSANALDMNPYSDMTDAELAEAAQEAFGNEDVGQQKLATDILGGKIMAHACVHELSLIKEAVAKGVCRVCKKASLGKSGKSVCAACAS